MLQVNGFYGHVKSNDFRSLIMFGGFIIAFQLAAATALVVPLLFLDPGHVPFWSLSGYFFRYGIYIMLISVTLFGMQFILHEQSTRASARYYYVDRRTFPRLVNLVEQQAIAAGLPMPRVALIDTPARNAFACGIAASSAVVVATRGLVEALDDDELKAVVAHEIAHIANGDIRLMAAANIMMNNLLFVQNHNPLRVNSNKKIVLMLLLPPFLVLVIFAGFINHVATALARSSRLLISSSREFIADAEAVRLTHNPAALISALRKIEGRSHVDGIDPEADSMMIDGATDGALATHPTISERVAVLARLSGSMAFDMGPRKDTRPQAYQPVQQGRGFGRKGASAASAQPWAPAPPVAQQSPATPPWGASRPWEVPASGSPTTSSGSGLLDRIKDSNDRNAMGLLPEHVRKLRFGCLGLLLLQMGCAGLITYSTRNVGASDFSSATSQIDSDTWSKTDKKGVYERRDKKNEVARVFE